MDLPPGDISHLVFRRVLRDGAGGYSLTGKMLSVLFALDGRQPAGALSEGLGVPIGEIRDALSRLSALGLAELAPDQMPVLDAGFFGFLRGQLSLAIGPIAEVVIEDAVADLGEDAMRLPANRAAELVELVCREIHREDRRAAFQRAMLERLRHAV